MSAADLLERYRQAKLRIVTAESCTGGMVAAALTDIAGSSDVVERGFVTYSNQAKTELLGVPAPLIAAHGAVSAEVAEAMARGALAHAPVGLAVSITGIAGPGGAMPGKPVGLVHLAAASRGGRRSHQARQFGDIGRAAVRRESVRLALAMLHALADQEAPSPPSPPR